MIAGLNVTAIILMRSITSITEFWSKGQFRITQAMIRLGILLDSE